MSRNLTVEAALFEAVAAEMELDPAVIYICRDIAPAPFSLGAALLGRFGSARVWDAQTSESALAGATVGAAASGLRPIVELGFVDRALDCLGVIGNQAAKLRYLTNGKLTIPAVFLSVQGMTRSGAQHSQSLEAMFAHIPGLTVALPSNAAAALTVTRTAIRSSDPMVVLVDKRMWSDPGPVDSTDPRPIGSGEIVRLGHSVTVVAIGWMVREAQRAAETLAADGIELEIIDPLTVVPLDLGTILRSVRKTGRLLVVHEAVQFGGIGAEIVASVVGQGWEFLKVAPRRVGLPFIPAPANVQQIADVLPSHRDIETAARELNARL